MAKKTAGGKITSVHLVEERAEKLAQEMSLELVEVALQKESRGKCLCVYVDKEGGLSLDDCERYHRALQPMLDDIDYDFMEVSSPGIDRPIKTARDFEKNRDVLVEVRLFAPIDGSRSYQGLLKDMDSETVTICDEANQSRSFPRKAVAIIKPIIQFEDDDIPQDGQRDIKEDSDMELESESREK